MSSRWREISVSGDERVTAMRCLYFPPTMRQPDGLVLVRAKGGKKRPVLAAVRPSDRGYDVRTHRDFARVLSERANGPFAAEYRDAGRFDLVKYADRGPLLTVLVAFLSAVAVAALSINKWKSVMGSAGAVVVFVLVAAAAALKMRSDVIKDVRP